MQALGAKKLVRITAEAQNNHLLDALKSKTIHGAFIKTSMADTRDFKWMHKWLKKGKQCAKTEVLMVAA